MNDSTKQPASVNIQLPTVETIASKRSLIPVSFAVIIIFFFFSFVDFKCNGTTAESLTGYNLVFGTHLQNPVNNAFAYNIYSGTSPNKLYTCTMVYNANEYYLKTMDLEKPYFFSIEAINENGVSSRTQVIKVD